MQGFTTLGDGIDALTLGDRPEPQPGPNEVVVQMRAATLNYRDLLVVNGAAHWKPRSPRIPVSDAVGIVVAIGDAVSRVQPGDRVAGLFLPRWLDGELTAEGGVGSLGGAAVDGVLVECRAFHEEAVVRVPGHLTDAEAAALPVAGLTAWHAVRRRSRVRSGDRVLIQGTGGVSLAAMQFVNALGAEAIVLSSSDEKLDRVRALGAAAVINYKRTPSWEDAVRELTAGRGVDHVIEVVGGENLNRSLKAVRVSGTISFIGLLAGLGGPVDTFQFVGKNVHLHGIETGSREMFAEMNDFIEGRQLRPIIDRTFGFAQARDAMRYLASGSHFGKVAVAF